MLNGWVSVTQQQSALIARSREEEAAPDRLTKVLIESYAKVYICIYTIENMT